MSPERMETPNDPQRQPEHEADPNQFSSTSSRPEQLSLQQAVAMMKLATLSVDQLRADGYPENLIQNIERNRPQLEATWRRMQLQRMQAVHQQQQQPHPHPSQNQHQEKESLLDNSSLPTGGGPPITNGSGRAVLSSPGSGAQSAETLDHQCLSERDIRTPSVLRKPTTEMVRQASSTIEQLMRDVSTEHDLGPGDVKHLSDAEKEAFPAQLEHLCNVTRDISRFYQVYLAATDDLPLIKDIINMLRLCDNQQQLLQLANPVYVLDISTLQSLTETATEAKGRILAVVERLRDTRQQEQNPSIYNNS